MNAVQKAVVEGIRGAWLLRSLWKTGIGEPLVSCGAHFVQVTGGCVHGEDVSVESSMGKES